MSTTAKRERWTDGKQDQLYAKYFTPLLTDSILEYLEALYQQQYYESQYIEVYTASDENSQQRTSTTRTAVSNINNRQGRSSGLMDTPTYRGQSVTIIKLIM